MSVARSRWFRATAALALVVISLVGLPPVQAGAIDGGAEIPDPNPYPFVGLFKGPTLQCTATLVATGWALTASHCTDDGTGHIAPVSTMKITFDLRSRDDDGIDAKVLEVLLAPGSLDVVLLRITEVPVAPVRLVGSTDDPIFTQEVLTAIGWGDDEVLREANQKVVDTSASLAKVVSGYQELMKTAPSHPLGGRIESGDSGGPLLRRDPDTLEWVQVAVVSGEKKNCGPRVRGRELCVHHDRAYDTKLTGTDVQKWLSATIPRSTSVTLVPYQAPGWSFSIDGGPTEVGTGAFGSGGYCPLQATVATDWPVGTELRLERTVTVAEGDSHVLVHVAIDNDVKVFWNDQLVVGVSREFCAALDDVTVQLTDDEVLTGANRLTVVAVDRGDQSFVDVSVTATR